MLDSGASRHFTFDINDFVVYEAIPEHIQVLTATTTTNIIGVGTVIINTRQGAHRISPVWYIPDLNHTTSVTGTVPSKRTLFEGECSRNILIYERRKNTYVLPSKQE
jgi:hypothetical protein